MDDGEFTDDEMDSWGSGGGGPLWGVGTSTSYANAYNSIDAGYHYSVDLSQAANSSSFYGGIFSNGYIACGYYANPCNTNTQAQARSANPLLNITYTNKVMQQQANGNYHGFPFIVDNYGYLGELTIIKGGDGQQYTKLTISGSYLGSDGYFEYIWNKDGLCNHRMFRSQQY